VSFNSSTNKRLKTPTNINSRPAYLLVLSIYSIFYHFGLKGLPGATEPNGNQNFFVKVTTNTVKVTVFYL
jgi:hypothetical protein